jgi:hypothetical protein
MEWLRKLFDKHSAEKSLIRSPLQIWEVKKIALIGFHYRSFKGEDRQRADRLLAELESRLVTGKFSLIENRI